MSTSIYASAPLALKSNRGDMMGASDTCTHSELLYRGGIQNLRPRIFNQTANITASKKYRYLKGAIMTVLRVATTLPTREQEVIG